MPPRRTSTGPRTTSRRADGVGRTARTRLAEAQRHFEAALAGAEAQPQQAIETARRAERLAEEAYALADNDFTDWDGGGWGGPGAPSRTSGSDTLGAILGGILGGVLSGGGAAAEAGADHRGVRLARSAAAAAGAAAGVAAASAAPSAAAAASAVVAGGREAADGDELMDATTTSIPCTRAG